MSPSDIYLMALGPVLALVAGLFIYLAATLGRSNSGEKVLRAEGGAGTGSGRQKR